MVGKVIPANKAEKNYHQIIREYCGCLPCIIEYRLDRHATIQHVTEGRKRLGQSEVYGSCEWHHLGTVPDGQTLDAMQFRYGPSLAHGKKPFEDMYGDELQLIKLQRFFVSLWERNPWEPHHVPAWAAREVIAYWQILQSNPRSALIA